MFLPSWAVGDCWFPSFWTPPQCSGPGWLSFLHSKTLSLFSCLLRTAHAVPLFSQWSCYWKESRKGFGYGSKLECLFRKQMADDQDRWTVWSLDCHFLSLMSPKGWHSNDTFTLLPSAGSRVATGLPLAAPCVWHWCLNASQDLFMLEVCSTVLLVRRMLSVIHQPLPSLALVMFTEEPPI